MTTSRGPQELNLATDSDGARDALGRVDGEGARMQRSMPENSRAGCEWSEGAVAKHVCDAIE